jgi:hypothetical protein
MCSASETNTPASTFSLETTPFNDRSPETRDARLANTLLALNEDIPMDADESIKAILENNTDTISSVLGAMEYLVDDNYLDYKEAMAEKKTTTSALPKSKAY